MLRKNRQNLPTDMPRACKMALGEPAVLCMPPGTPGELEAGARGGHQGFHFGSMSLSLS